MSYDHCHHCFCLDSYADDSGDNSIAGDGSNTTVCKKHISLRNSRNHNRFDLEIKHDLSSSMNRINFF